ARGWPQYELGITENSPANWGIPPITEWTWPPHEKAANVRPWPAIAEELYAKELAKYNE
ncbi:MAG: hypothetical protein GX182_05590, partial [Firmicutes bacterium]|nr:hypothetical protein [Bacillota bacterium]